MAAGQPVLCTSRVEWQSVRKATSPCARLCPLQRPTVQLHTCPGPMGEGPHEQRQPGRLRRPSPKKPTQASCRGRHAWGPSRRNLSICTYRKVASSGGEGLVRASRGTEPRATPQEVDACPWLSVRPAQKRWESSGASERSRHGCSCGKDQGGCAMVPSGCNPTSATLPLMLGTAKPA